MATSASRPKALHQKLDDAAIVPRPTRNYRAVVSQAYVLIAAAVFVGLAVTAHFVPYFPIDLIITRAIQSYHGAAFDAVLRAVSWLGFPPQVNVLGAMVLLILFLAGLRWEAVAAMIALCGVGL